MLTLACASFRDPIYFVEPDLYADTPILVVLHDGELRIECLIDLPSQDFQDDERRFGWDWLQVWYSGTYVPPDCLLMAVKYYFTLPIWLFGFLLFLSSGGVLSRTLLRQRFQRPGCCSKCGYDLTGNVSGRCPECGERIVAARKEVKRTARQRWMRAAKFAVAMPLGGLAVMLLLDVTVIPSIVEESATVILEQSRSDRYGEITLELCSKNWYLPGLHAANEPWQVCNIHLDDDRRNRILAYLDNMRFYTVDDEEKEVTSQALLEWLKETRPDLVEDGSADEIDVVFQIIVKAADPVHPIAKQGSFRVAGYTRSSWSQGACQRDPFIAAGINTSVFEDAQIRTQRRVRRIALIHESLLFTGTLIWLYGVGRLLLDRSTRSYST